MKHTQNIVVAGVAAIALLVSSASMVSAYSQSKKVAHLESLVDSMNVALAKVKTMTLKDINQLVAPYARTRNNLNWEAKVRQVLQNDRYFERVAPGTYKLAA